MKLPEHLERRLRILEMEQERQEIDIEELKDFTKEVKALQAEFGLPEINLSEEATVESSAPVEDIDVDKVLQEGGEQVQYGFVVCLMFNPKTPSEWSEEAGGGWREKGKGKCYSSIEDAKQRLQTLKKQWPDYPLKVVKR